MERSFVYILKVFLLMGLFSCQNDKNVDLLSLTEEQKVEKTKQLRYDRSFHYQASVMRQVYTDSLIILNPENPEYYQDKSIAHSKIGDYHISIPLLEKAMELDPKETLYYTAWLMTDLYKDYDRAIKYLNQFDDYTPQKVDYAWGENVNYLKGEVLQAMGKHNEAIEEFTKVIEEEGDFIDDTVYVYRGISLVKIKKYNEALADYNKALEVYDKSSMAYYYKGIALVETGDIGNAIIQLKKAKDLIKKGYKKSDPYKEVYNEIYLMQVEDKLKEIERNMK